jgi:hypothetical protein
MASTHAAVTATVAVIPLQSTLVANLEMEISLSGTEPSSGAPLSLLSWKPRPAFTSAGAAIADPGGVVRVCDVLEQKASVVFAPSDVTTHAILLVLQKRPWEVLRYELGGCFRKHTDTVLKTAGVDEEHVATALLFPPATMFPFTGGEIHVWDPATADAPTILSPASWPATQWTLVTLPLGLPHAVAAVTSTTPRFVLKTPVFVPRVHIPPVPQRLAKRVSDDVEDGCDQTTVDLFGGDY